MNLASCCHFRRETTHQSEGKMIRVNMLGHISQFITILNTDTCYNRYDYN